MVRMLFLRDIDTDVDIRCRDCGHGGVLPRAMLVRRFGPSYPVLSIAPHYRCSRCDSRDTECRPAPPPEPEVSFGAGAPADDGGAAFDATIAALRGMVDAAQEYRTGPAAAADEDPDDTVIRPSARNALWEELAEPSLPPEEADADDGWSRPPAAFHEPVAADPPEEQEPDGSGLPPDFAALFERAYADDPEEDAPPPQRDRPVFTADWDDEEPDGEEPDGEEPDGEEADADVRALFADPPDRAPAVMTDAEEEPEPSDAEILSFAIRDRDEDSAPRNRRSTAARAEDESDATLSMQKTLAALRGMIENAAAEPGDLPPPTKAPPPQPPAKPPTGTGAASLDDTLAKLRGLLDLENPGDDGGRNGERPTGGRRR
ncbi:hypothetical protein [Azospirillum oleiclasticum]|uniref:Uncharacterized protein n=1 Tax=Azospirillum oleiclasticum TaxID=2735135 RepID=A0ABX2T8P1_9PROT|nr:hypothetical protein [Azospirillum oleiclasticum]NYZ20559.1 hypothetical protein [Azospirillum oleiclasticum]